MEREPFSKEVEKPTICSIVTFLHCKLCMDTKPSHKSPKEWARLNVGWSRSGIQAWCVRHECNVVHLDFMDQKVAADFTVPVDMGTEIHDGQ